jgi:hypothetical protein
MNQKLPRDLSLTQSNMSAHRSTMSFASFTLLHSMLLLSKIILHREWIPFLPVRDKTPRGPIDTDSPFSATTVPPKGPFTFWDQSAGELFGSAKHLLDLLAAGAEWKVLPETPLVGFAAYMVTLLGIYSTHFPWMDVNERMSKSLLSATGNGGFLALVTARDADMARKAADIVVQFRPTLRMADNWFKTLQNTHKHILKIKKTLRRHWRDDFEPGKGRSVISTVAEMGDKYEPLEAMFGPYVEDFEMADASPVNGTEIRQPSTEGGASRDELSWNAINAAASAQQLNADHTDSTATPPQQQPSDTSSPLVRQQPVYATTNSTVHSSAPPHLPAFIPTLPPSTPQASAPLQVTPAPQPDIWTQDEVNAWLGTKETKFGAQDVAAFVEGIDGPQMANIGGWLSEIFRRRF